MTRAGRAGPVGRVIRLLLGICLAIITLPVYFEADRAYIVASLGLLVALTGVYTVLHYFFSRLRAGINRWIGSVLAVIPAFLTWYLGQGGGPLFGEGEGGTAALTYLTISFLVDFVRGNSGCEVMALPGLIFGNRSHLPCLLLAPIDHSEAG